MVGFFVALILLLLASPLWFPWLLKPVANRYGADFAHFERRGYDRLILEDVSYAKGETKIHADKVELYQPLVWLWLHQTKGHATSKHVIVNRWLLEISPSKKPTKKKSSPIPVFEQIEKLTPSLKSWLPAATLSNGIVRVGTNDIHIGSAEWKNGVLQSDFTPTKFDKSAQCELNLSQADQIDLSLKVPALETETKLHLKKETQGLRIDGDLFWKTNRAALSADFDAEHILPVSANVESTSLRIPARQVRITNYNDLEISFIANWNGTNFLVNLRASAEPQKNSYPPIKAVVRAHGDTNAIRFETFSLSLPWGKADLSRDAEVSFKGRLLSETVEFRVTADLSKQNFFPATGQISGQWFLRRNETIYPDAIFKLAADDLGYTKYKSERVEVEGEFEWPEVRLDRFLIALSDASAIAGKGVFNLQNKSISNGILKVEGTLPPSWLPSNIVTDKIFLSARFSGPVQKISHEGKLEVQTLVVPHLHPLKLKAQWHAQHLNFSSFETVLSTSNAVFQLAGSAKVSTNDSSMFISTANLATNGVAALTLQQPGEITLQKKQTSLWNIVVTPFRWQGAGGKISISGSATSQAQGYLSLDAQDLHTDVLRGLIRDRLPEAGLDTLHLLGGWTNAPMVFSLSGAGFYEPPRELPIKIHVTANGNNEGVRFEDLSVQNSDKTILSAKGNLPLRLDPSNEKKKINLNLDAPIDFHASTAANDAFWGEVEKVAKLKLDRPEISLTISGTLNKPVAQVSARADGIEWLGANRPLPRIADLRADVHADRKVIQLEQLYFQVEGQPIYVRAEMPIGDFSNQLKQAFDWHNASGHIVMKEARIEPFIRYLPAVLGPSGTVDLNVTFSPGAKLNGDLQLKNIETRPLSTVGSFHDLQAHLKFTESVVQFTNVTGVIGGEPVGLSGFINFAERGPNKLPLFDLNIAGRGVPLTRKPDLILRADFELNALNTKTNDQPVVSGLVNFNQSFFLGDLKMLLPGKVTKPKERPPFFSVEAEPFSKWHLNVRLVGENFMSVRTPLFRGAISANWRLRGTLREPIALGDAKIESGQVQFPFANLRVQQGFVTLTSEDPYRPHIFATASSRTFGYDVQMVLNGPADKPIIEFSSTPPLTSEQIVLMLTAGELPKREATFSTQQRAGRLAMFLGKSLLSKFSSDEGGGERLTITSGENVTEQGKETYALEYKITDNVSIVGEYDRFGAWNGGVKWRVYSK